MTQLYLVRLVLKRSLEVSGAEPIFNYECPQVSRILILRCKLTDDINSWISYVICFTNKLSLFSPLMLSRGVDLCVCSTLHGKPRRHSAN